MRKIRLSRMIHSLRISDSQGWTKIAHIWRAVLTYPKDFHGQQCILVFLLLF